jgi:hypothetical protein
MTMRDGGALERRREGGREDSGDELHIVFRHQTNSPLQDCLVNKKTQKNNFAEDIKEIIFPLKD